MADDQRPTDVEAWKAVMSSTTERLLKMDRQPPQATVTQAGRWSYRVEVTHGLFSAYDGVWWGRRRAEVVARRRLDRYVRQVMRRAKWRDEQIVIKVADVG